MLKNVNWIYSVYYNTIRAIFLQLFYLFLFFSRTVYITPVPLQYLSPQSFLPEPAPQ